MNWSVVPILIATVVGLVGFCLMVAAFVLVAHKGGWQQAMRSGPEGRWSLPRRLMFAGALLGAVFGSTVVTLFLIPGGIPWSDSSGWAFLGVLLPPLLAVWYLVLRPTFASLRHHQTAGHDQRQSSARSEG
jgi:hypothetical protein